MFARQHGIGDAIGTAIRLTKKQFHPSSKLTVEFGGDPEWNEQWVVVHVATSGSIEAAANAYDSFLREWVKSADWAARSKIRLSYSIG